MWNWWFYTKHKYLVFTVPGHKPTSTSNQKWKITAANVKVHLSVPDVQKSHIRCHVWQVTCALCIENKSFLTAMKHLLFTVLSLPVPTLWPGVSWSSGGIVPCSSTRGQHPKKESGQGPRVLRPPQCWSLDSVFKADPGQLPLLHRKSKHTQSFKRSTFDVTD